jgi:hypothetical protein
MKRGFALAALLAVAGAAFADDPPVPDKSGYTLLDPVPDAQMRAFSTDRPPKANSPYTVDAGHFQYETDLAVYARGNEDGVESRQWTVADPTLKLGVSNGVDAELQLTPFLSQAAGPAPARTGVGDTTARMKWNLLGNDGGDLAVALLPYVKLPTARRPLGNRRIEGGLILPVAISAPGGFTVIVMPEADILSNSPAGGDHAVLDFLVNVSHPLGGRWTVFTEAYAAHAFRAGDREVVTLDEALTFAATSNLQFDLGGNFSANGVAPRVQLYTGLSQRF